MTGGSGRGGRVDSHIQGRVVPALMSRAFLLVVHGVLLAVVSKPLAVSKFNVKSPPPPRPTMISFDLRPLSGPYY